jgi:cysteine desulfurase
MLAVLGAAFGNPSSAHAAGDRAREYVRCAREAVATLLGADPSTLVFTSSGTESNHMVFASLLQQRQAKPRVVTTQIEHSSILKLCEYVRDLGVEVVYLPVNRAGHLSMAALEAAITPDTSLVSIQWVNNETGVIQPIEHIGALCRRREVPFHTDAAQAVGKLAMNVATLPIDFLSLTAHKFHGPQGIGALYTRTPSGLRRYSMVAPKRWGCALVLKTCLGLWVWERQLACGLHGSGRFSSISACYVIDLNSLSST